MKATPLRGTSKRARLTPWLTVPASDYTQCRKTIAPIDYDPHYQGHAGFYTGGLNGAFFLEVLERYPNGTVLVRNMHEVGKIPCPQVQAPIEADLVYPFLRGRSIARWRYQSAGHVLIVQDPDRQRGYDEQWMQETHPLTWEYLKRFEGLLRRRAAFRKFFNPDRDPFYSMYAISHYTFAPYKVVWMDVSATMKATVVSSVPDNSMPLPEHKLMLLTCASEDEAHYVAAVLNSHIVNTIISGYIVDNSVSTHPIENIIIPQFDPENATHKQLTTFSREAHAAAAHPDHERLDQAEACINEVVQALW